MSGTFEKSRFILYAIEQCRDGEAPIDEIFEFIKESKQLAPVAESFELTREDLDDIIDGMVACDAAGSHNGQFFRQLAASSLRIRLRIFSGPFADKSRRWAPITK